MLVASNEFDSQAHRQLAPQTLEQLSVIRFCWCALCGFAARLATISSDGESDWGESLYADESSDSSDSLYADWSDWGCRCPLWTLYGPILCDSCRAELAVRPLAPETWGAGENTSPSQEGPVETDHGGAAQPHEGDNSHP